MESLLQGYQADDCFDEAVDGGEIRPDYEKVIATLNELGAAELGRRDELRERMLRSRGVTFRVYNQGADRERTFPLDLVPRIIGNEEWKGIEAGLKQRVKALNLFLNDVYGEQAILHDGIVPRREIVRLPQFQRAAAGWQPPGGIRIQVAGLDLVRGKDGRWMVLEDNLRTPSGVSYVMENREVMAQVLPEFFSTVAIAPVDHYPQLLREALASVAPPEAGDRPRIVLLTPGVYNSAYFEHALLARSMGVDLVEGSDLLCCGGEVYERTTEGPRKVDVIYRRIDDEYLDPLAFWTNSVLGCPGLVNAARSGKVTLANAIGNGVADDKAIYPYVPDMIRYYLNESPLLDNVPTYLCRQSEDRETVLSRINELVVKPTDASGGYGVVIGPHATPEELDRTAAAIRENPEGYIAQETVRISSHPTLIGDRLEPRHVDLRPFIVSGETIEVLPGGLTRVALRKGNLVVNSSQGGGSKDTWVLTDPIPRHEPSSRSGRQHEVIHLARLDGPSEGIQEQQQQQQQTAREGNQPC